MNVLLIYSTHTTQPKASFLLLYSTSPVSLRQKPILLPTYLIQPPG
jgi:hypothetical protein